jgi:hypothetical protein
MFFNSLNILVITFDEPELLFLGFFIAKGEEIYLGGLPEIKLDKPWICVNFPSQVEVCIRYYLAFKMLV